MNAYALQTGVGFAMVVLFITQTVTRCAAVALLRRYAYAQRKDLLDAVSRHCGMDTSRHGRMLAWSAWCELAANIQLSIAMFGVGAWLAIDVIRLVR